MADSPQYPKSLYDPPGLDPVEWARAVRWERGQRPVTRYELLDALYAIAVHAELGARAQLEHLRKDWGIE